MKTFSIRGNIVDVLNRDIFPGEITVQDGFISKIEVLSEKISGYILPGLIDSHVHIESSMLPPSEFARIASVHGTSTTVSDPHEIANVLGIDGVNYMFDDGKKVPFKFNFGAPSCVPATDFESSGGKISVSDIKKLLSLSEIKYLSEMMNFPGVIFGSPEVIEKINIAKDFGKPIDGHAPGLTGENLIKYCKAGITTDHECFSLSEALEKIALGMRILIREGSAAKNYEALHSLLDTNPDDVMFCCDDIHPDDLIRGHINSIAKRAISDGHDIFSVLAAVTVNPVRHYNLNSGLLQNGDSADFILIDDFENFNILETYCNGIKTAESGKPLIEKHSPILKNNFKAENVSPDDFRIIPQNRKIRVIEALDGELITNEIFCDEKISANNVVSDIDNDILKIAVINRYQLSKPAIAFIKNFGLKKGAIASSIAHDSHNIIAVGTTDEELANAINLIVANKGGLAVVCENVSKVLPLPIGGIMTNLSYEEAALQYSELCRLAGEFGSKLKSPFMTLSFIALLVIPNLKLSDRGLFDGKNFTPVNLHID